MSWEGIDLPDVRSTLRLTLPHEMEIPHCAFSIARSSVTCPEGLGLDPALPSSRCMKRSIVITDLTRFRAGNPNVCLAGIDRATGECIRPMPYLSSAQCADLGIRPGVILSGQFTRSRIRTGPHREDCSFRELEVEGVCAGSEFRRLLLGSCFPGIEAGFSTPLQAGEKVLPVGTAARRSIITLKTDPRTVTVVANPYNVGGTKLHFVDPDARLFRDIPITDRGFHELAERYRGGGTLHELNSHLASQREIFLRIGLSRIFRNRQGKEGYWIQVNGIHVFPAVLRSLAP